MQGDGVARTRVVADIAAPIESCRERLEAVFARAPEKLRGHQYGNRWILRHAAHRGAGDVVTRIDLSAVAGGTRLTVNASHSGPVAQADWDQQCLTMVAAWCRALRFPDAVPHIDRDEREIA